MNWVSLKIGDSRAKNSGKTVVKLGLCLFKISDWSIFPVLLATRHGAFMAVRVGLARKPSPFLCLCNLKNFR